MTLIIAHSSLRSAVMVADRRLTRGETVFDEQSNKMVLFSDTNAVVCLSYTGIAFVGATPMDQWIAEALTELSFPQGHGGRGTVPALMIKGYSKRYWGQRLQGLAARLSHLRSELQPPDRDEWMAREFGVLVAGFEWNHGEVRPAHVALQKNPDANEVTIERPPRGWYLPRLGLFPTRITVMPKQNLGDGERVTLQRLASEAQLDHATALTEVVRSMAETKPYVGRDTSSVEISSPAASIRRIRVRFFGSAGGAEAFTPWVIESRSIIGPSKLTNAGLQARCGPYTVEVHGVEGYGDHLCVESTRRRLPRYAGSSVRRSVNTARA